LKLLEEDLRQFVAADALSSQIENSNVTYRKVLNADWQAELIEGQTKRHRVRASDAQFWNETARRIQFNAL
jgi:hypothetical protein